MSQDDRVEHLCNEGRHEEAAAICAQAGRYEQAAALYAAAWRWQQAHDAAIEAARYDLAYRFTIEGDLHAERAAVLDALVDHSEQLPAAIACAQKKGRHADAAKMLEARDELNEAATLYERGGELLHAARCLEMLDETRAAGRLYERHLERDPGDGEAALRLGRLLFRMGRCDAAIRELQKVESDPDRAPIALPLLIASFDALDLNEAAHACLLRLHEHTPHAATSVADFLRHPASAPAVDEASDDDSDPKTSLLAGRYQIVRSLGEGATGRVLLARDFFYDRLVAVKTLRAGGARARESLRQLAREARIAAGLEHPNIVQVIELNGAGPFLVMEYLEGGTLQEKLAHGMLDLPAIRRILLGILRGLAAAHRRGVVHRDIKPANIFFDATGGVKVGDFGIAHMMDAASTLTGAMIGTLAYIAPEQITAMGTPTAATDLYAVGVVAHRLLTGSLPFPGPDFVDQHLTQTPPRPSEVAPSLGTIFDDWILRLLAKEPTDRFASATDAAEALSAIALGSARLPPPSTTPVAKEASISETPSERYRSDGQREPVRLKGAQALRDQWLERDVLRVPCEADRFVRLRALAQGDSPWLQTIYALDVDARIAIVEAPSGERLDDLAEDDPRWPAALEDIDQALRALHRNGIVHGQVRADHIVVGKGRSVLLLPLEDERDAAERSAATMEDDLRALAALRSGA